MATIELSRDQQDLIELLTGELQKQLDDSLLRSDAVSGPYLLQLAEELQHLTEAAGMIGLQGLNLAWQHVTNNLLHWSENTEQVSSDQQNLIDSWVIYSLDYLQQIIMNTLTEESIQPFSELLLSDDWVEKIPEAKQPLLIEQLLHIELHDEPIDEANQLPTKAVMEMLSLSLSDDINPELFEGLMMELPSQVNQFSACIAEFNASGNDQSLAAAQRVAHTLKGSGNVVGVTGLANFMHFSEDLLDEIARYKLPPPRPLKALLIDIADTLATLLDLLLVGESAGKQELTVMQHVLDAYHLIREQGFSAFEVGTQETNSPLTTYMADSTLTEATAELSVTPTAPAAEENTGINLQEALSSHIRVKEEVAQELLRLAGNSAITTNRLQSQVDDVKQQLNHMAYLQTKLNALTEEFGHLIEVQTLFSARSVAHGISGLDSLELDRYNELHSFFHQLQEVVTDTRDGMHQTRNQLRSLEEQAFEQQVHNRDVQTLLLGMRMIPAMNLESRFQRCVRQACRLTGKEAELIIEGGETMIDTRVLNDIVDPIMHLLRNAVGHGIETEEQRFALGKPLIGKIILRFFSQGQHIAVEIIDDGQGINYQKIKQRAENLSLAIPDHLESEALTRWLNQLIFAPGFTTSDAVDQTSGRGIGLDMVADRIGLMKGRVSVESDLGVGCRFVLRLPTMMISEHSLLIKSGSEKLAIVARGVSQLLYVTAEDIDYTDDRPRFFFKEDWIDVVPLDLLASHGEQLAGHEIRALLIVEPFAEKAMGVLIEQVLASREMVIKPLSTHTPIIAGVIGATILGDGGVAPVLDIQQLAIDFLAKGFDYQEIKRRVLNDQVDHRLERPLALVIDDSLSSRRALAQFISDSGLDVATAKDGFEAVDLLQRKRPAIIFVDMEMPRMNGLEFTAHVRADEMTRDIPVIMVTSRNTEKHRKLAQAAGVDDYLTKPFVEDELLAHLQSINSLRPKAIAAG